MVAELGRGARRGRAAAVAGLIAAISLGAADRAGAHDGSHPFESVISGVVPARLAAGVTVRIVDYDEQIELTNRSGRRVVVAGYAGEPYARVESDGPVFLNVRSPSLHISNDRWGRTPPNGSGDAAARPEWVRVGGEGRVSWFDRRAHYRRRGIPAGVRDPAFRTKLWSYRLPITVGGEPAAIRGTLFWAGRRSFPTGPFVILLIATGGCALLGAWAVKRMRSADGPSGDACGRA